MKFQTRFLPLVALAILALVTALWAGLVRLGWALPATPDLSAAHGPLMVSGFLGVLIPLERAVAIRQKWMFAVPVIAGLGWIMLFIHPFTAAVLITLGSIGTLVILIVMVRRERHIHTFTMAAGALAYPCGFPGHYLLNPETKIIFIKIVGLISNLGIPIVFYPIIITKVANMKFRYV